MKERLCGCAGAIELRRCVGVWGVEREICGVSYETSSTNEAHMKRER